MKIAKFLKVFSHILLIILVFPPNSFSQNEKHTPHILINYTENHLPIIYFDVDSYRVEPEYYPRLNKFAERIKKDNLIVEITGYGDDIGPKWLGSELTANRANAMCNYLVENGCNRRNLTVVGRGDAESVSTEEDRTKNRRVEFRIME